jgi:hypothetical protein
MKLNGKLNVSAVKEIGLLTEAKQLQHGTQGHGVMSVDIAVK